ncbi:hypothetical protein Droror1_Dr00021057 [Drosera rotundifolia]
MGIKDLLRFMKPYTESINIGKYAGKRVGIDAYSWLHKGAYSCSMELTLNLEGEKKLQYINYFMHRINLLRHYKVTPVVVFDGGSIPCKAMTEDERHRRRNANKELAMEKLKEGNVVAATEMFQRATIVTPAMAHQLTQILRKENIEFMVAPYEADAQLAYLSSLEEDQGGVVAVITEDSDLLAYGCPAIIFKMDRYGNGEEIVLEKVFTSMNICPSFKSFTQDLFTGMCVLAGCDFLRSIPGIGIAKAHSLVSKYQDIDRVLSSLKFKKANQMAEDYSRSFSEAVAVFQHARVYDRSLKRLKHLKPLSDKLLQKLEGELDFLGPDITPAIATAIAHGNLDPTTMEAFDQHTSSFPRYRDNLAKPCSENKNMASEASAESCFTLYSTQKFKERSFKIADKAMAQRQVLQEKNYWNEAAQLANLVPAFKVNDYDELVLPRDLLPIKTPDNNPFKKRKHNEISLVSQSNNDTEPESGMTETEDATKPLSNSQESVNSRPEKLKDVHGIPKVGKILQHTRADKLKNLTRKGSILSYFSRI